MKLKVQLKPYAFPPDAPPDDLAAGTQRVRELLAEVFPDAEIEVRAPDRACGTADLFDSMVRGPRDKMLWDIEATDDFMPGEAERVVDAALVIVTFPMCDRLLARLKESA